MSDGEGGVSTTSEISVTVEASAPEMTNSNADFAGYTAVLLTQDIHDELMTNAPIVGSRPPLADRIGYGYFQFENLTNSVIVPNFSGGSTAYEVYIIDYKGGQQTLRFVGGSRNIETARAYATDWEDGFSTNHPP